MKKLIPLCLQLLAIHAFAATYYVKPVGNNTSNGTSIANAFQTLQHASDVAEAGDSVIVLAGTYSGFYQTSSGTAAQPIVFSAEANVIINTPNNTTNDGINLEGSDYVVIEGFKITGVPRAGIRSVINTGVVIKNNIADQCGVWGILTGFSENILIENNECSRSVQQHGIYFSNSADNPIIRNNICWGNNDCGIHMNGDISMGGDGIISNALVEKNIIYNNGAGGGSGINCDGVQNSRIQNNLLYNNHSSGISLYQIDAGDAAKNNIIANNTILQPADGRWALNIMDGSTGNKVFNNIFYSAHSFRGSISIDPGSLSGFHSNNNVLTNRMSSDGGNSNQTLAQWKQTTLSDSSSITSTPTALFVNASSDDYHLSVSSPAINMAWISYYSAAAPVTDLDNVARPQGAQPDAGCYERITTTGLKEISETIPGKLNWRDVSPATNVFVYDVSGRMIESGKKEDVEQRLKKQPALYIFKTSSVKEKVLTGWVHFQQ